ncbi:MAG: hypothetical protein V7K35_16515 [Nostoc sp.]|uniref:hypothetical protein n=1 Tax=Nostoc sp. TaxID=1180 RepID=UPI002FF6391D
MIQGFLQEVYFKWLLYFRRGVLVVIVQIHTAAYKLAIPAAGCAYALGADHIEFGQLFIEFGQPFIEFGQSFIEFGQSFIEFGQSFIEFGQSFIEFGGECL